ncbi:MAG: histidine phosphatase family protein [Anaerolineae bacterium]|nr:histidine phosphatase family protein [Anaerolineae bacterium]MDW8099506.1 histidine phosphatase family protein [Anaerolineae bacterium]
MTITLLLVRHGQTAWNREERFRGRTDLPLNEAGLQQAEAVACRIAAEYRPIAVLTSPLQRAIQTAEVIARPFHLRVQPHEGLLDLDYGDFAGLSPAEAEARFPELYRTWLNAPHCVRFPHGESLGDVRARSESLVHELIELYPNESVVLVSHLIVCRVLMCRLLGLHEGYILRFQVDTASLTVFEADHERARLILANDTCHLKGN